MITLYDIPAIMIRCLVCTVIIECIIAFIIGIRNKKDFLNVILVNCITNPIVVTVPLYFNIRYGIIERRVALLILEILTIICEGFIYKKILKFKKINPYIISIVLNAGSYFIGEIINKIIYIN